MNANDSQLEQTKQVLILAPQLSQILEWDSAARQSYKVAFTIDWNSRFKGSVDFYLEEHNCQEYYVEAQLCSQLWDVIHLSKSIRISFILLEEFRLLHEYMCNCCDWLYWLTLPATYAQS